MTIDCFEKPIFLRIVYRKDLRISNDKLLNKFLESSRKEGEFSDGIESEGIGSLKLPFLRYYLVTRSRINLGKNKRKLAEKNSKITTGRRREWKREVKRE